MIISQDKKKCDFHVPVDQWNQTNTISIILPYQHRFDRPAIQDWILCIVKTYISPTQIFMI